MKRIALVLSFIIALLQVQPAFAESTANNGQEQAAAVESAAKDNEYTKAKNFLEAMGVHYYSENPSAAVSTETFVSALYTALKTEKSAVSTAFLTGLSYSSEKGAEKISFADAARCLVTALGYKVRAEMKGGQDFIYAGVAGNIGLLSGVKVKNGNEVSSRDAAVMLYNALTTDMLQDANHGTSIEYRAIEGETLLYRYRKIKKGQGVVNANSDTSLYSAAGGSEGRICINNVWYSDDKAAAQSLLGYSVDFWFEEDTHIKTAPKLIYAAKNNDTNKVIEIDGNFGRNIQRTVYYYSESGSEQRKDIAGDAAVIYNGAALEDYDNTIFDFSYNQALLIDNDADGDIDVVLISEYKDWYVYNINTEMRTVYDKISGQSLNMNDPKIGTVNIYEADGAESSFYAIEPDNILTVYTDKESRVRNIYRSTKQITGKINSTTKKYGRLYITVEGEKYRVSVAFEKSDAKNLISGNSAKFYLNYRGEITYGVFLETGMKYGYAMSKAKEKGLSQTPMLRILTDTGEKQGMKLKKSVKVDGEYKTDKKAYDDLTLPCIIRYGADENGEIYEIDTEMQGTKETDEQMSAFRPDFEKLMYVSTGFSFDNCFRGNEQTVVFFCPTDAAKQSDENYGVSKLSYLVSGFEYKVKAFTSSPDNYIADAVIIDGSVKDDEKVTNRSDTYVFKDYEASLSDDNELQAHITVMRKVTEEEHICITELTEEVSELNRGDVINLRFNNEGLVSDIVKVYDSETHSLLSSPEIDGFAGTSKESRCRMIAGYVYFLGENSVGISNVDPKSGVIPTKGELEYVRLTDSIGTIVDSNYKYPDARHIKRANVADIKDYMHYNDCARIFIRIEQRGTNCFVVYQ